MKKLLLLFLLPICLNAQQQVERFEITPDGVNQFVVVETAGSAEELFVKTKNWINRSFKNPEQVMPRLIENEMIGGEMYFSEALKVNNSGVMVYFDMKLSYTYEFRDGRFKLEVYNVYFPPPPTSQNTWGVFDYKGGALAWSFYNNRGVPRKRAEEQFKQAEDLLNFLHEDLKLFMEGEKQSDW